MGTNEQAARGAQARTNSVPEDEPILSEAEARSMLDSLYAEEEAAAKLVRTGSQVLLTYPEGDVDMVTVVELTHAQVVVRLPDGRLYSTVHEDLGLGVDDELTFVLDDGCTTFEHLPSPDPSAEAHRLMESAEVITGRSTLRQGARTIYLLGTTVKVGGETVGQAGAWFARNEAAFRRVQWEVEEVTHGVVSGQYETLKDAADAVTQAAKVMAILTLFRRLQATPVHEGDPEQGSSIDGHSAPTTQQSPEQGSQKEVPMGTEEYTVEQGKLDFQSCGVEVDAAEVPALVRRSSDSVWTFGYGWDDDPEPGFTTLSEEDLWAFEGPDADPATVASWAPFRVDPTELEHLRGQHDDSSDIECPLCRALFDSTSVDGVATPVSPEEEPTMEVDIDGLDEYLRVLAEQATELRVRLAAGQEHPELLVSEAIKDLSVGAAGDALTAFSSRAFRDLATGLAAATSPLRVR